MRVNGVIDEGYEVLYLHPYCVIYEKPLIKAKLSIFSYYS